MSYQTHTIQSPTQVASRMSQNPGILCFTVVEVQIWGGARLLLVLNFCYWWSWVIYWSAVRLERREGVQSSSPATERKCGTKQGRGRGWWVKLALGTPEAGALSLTCIPQKCSHLLSWAGTLGLCAHPPSLWLLRKEEAICKNQLTKQSNLWGCVYNIAYCME